MSGTRRSLENYDPAEQETLMYVKMHLRVTHSHVRSHHVDADEYGRPIMHSEPSHPPQDIQPARDGRAVINHGDLEQTGRPEWLVRLERLPTHRRVTLKIICLILIALLLAALFSFALSPSENEPSLWPNKPHGELKQSAPKTETMKPNAFPTYIGYPGSYSSGAPAAFANDMKPAASPTRGVEPIQTALAHFDKFNPFRHMGPLSPYYSAQHGNVDNARFLATPVSANGTCTLSQVHILHRHGSRYPTGGSQASLVANMLASKPKGEKAPLSFTGPLAFLNTYQYQLGEELLVPLGREQLHMSGIKAAIDYGRLAEKDLAENKRLFVRTGSQQRIVDSALAWSTGFWGNSWVNKTDFEVQIEEPGFNTTLAPNFACSAAADSFKIQEWIESYLGKATARLQQYVHGAEITPMIVYGMQQLCSYDTVAFGRSDFCSLFTEEEWLGFEFTWDKRFFFDYGPGNQVGPAMGLGWLNEFVSRLTRTPWNSTTQTSENATFNAHADLFPVDRAIYADFTHDSVLTSVLAALRLPEFSIPPKLDDKHRAFRTSQVVPFGARMVFEVFDCPTPVPPPSALEHRRIPLKAYPPEQYLRMKLNDAIVPLSGLSQCEDRKDGLCTLSGFLDSHADRNNQGWWDRCRG